MITVLVFAGEYDLCCKRELRAELDALVDEPDVVLDFTNVTFIDSTCPSELIRLHDARERNELPRVAIVVKPDDAIARLLSIVGMDAVFRLHDTLDATIPKNGETAQIRYAFSGPTEGLEAEYSHLQRA